jgi:hypothetical protein
METSTLSKSGVTQSECCIRKPVLVTPTALSSPCDLNTEKPGVVIFGEFTGNRIGSFHVQDLGVTPYPL